MLVPSARRRGAAHRSRPGGALGRARGAVPGDVALAVTVGLGYLVAAWLMEWIGPPDGPPSFWPAPGLAIGAALLVERRRWPVVLGAVVLAEVVNDLVHFDATPGTALGWGVANAVEVLAAACVAEAVARGPVRLHEWRGLLGLWAGCIAGPLVGAAVGASVGAAGADLAWLVTARGWWARDAVGIAVAGALVLSVRSPLLGRLDRARAGELAVLAALLGVAVPVAFRAETAVLYPLLPLVLWAAARFGVPGGAVALTVTVAAAEYATAHGYWPLGSGNTQHAAQALVGVHVVLTMLTAVGATRLYTANLRLRTHYERVQALVSRVPVTLFTVRADGSIDTVETAGAAGGAHAVPVAEELQRTIDASEVRSAVLRALRGDTTRATLRREGQVVDYHFVPRRGARGVTEVVGIAHDVTELLAVREALAESEARYRTIVEHANLGIWLTDERFRVTYANREVGELLGYDPAALSERTGVDVLGASPADVEAVRERLRHGAPVEEEATIVPHDGTRRRLRVSITPRIDEDGRFVGSLGIMADVTDRYRAERALRRREQRLRAIQRAIPDAILSTDRDGVVVEAEIPTGWPGSTADVLGRKLWAIAPPAQAELTAAAHARVLATGEPIVHEYSNERTPPRWYESRLVRQGDDHVLVLTRDITDRKLAELERDQVQERLAASERLYRSIVESSADGIVLVGRDRRIVFANARAGEILGASPGALAGRSYEEFIVPERAPLAAARHERFAAGERLRTEAEVRRLDGAVRVCYVAVEPLLDDAGELEFALFVLTDLTELYAERRERERLDTRFRAMVDSLSEGLVVLDAESRITYASPGLSRILGRPAAELAGVRGLDLLHPDDVGEGVQVLRRLVEAESDPVEIAHLRVVRPDGSVRWVAATGRNLLDDELLAGIVLSVRDITEAHAAAERNARLLERLAAAEDEERRRLAADLHDGPVQQLSAAMLRLGITRSLAGDPELGERLAAVEHVVQQTVQSLRLLMFELVPPDLRQAGLVSALRSFASVVLEDAAVEVAIDDRLAEEPDELVAATAYRIAREALFNVRKHAHAQRVVISATEEAGVLVLEIRDDGTGFDVDTIYDTGVHRGLVLMRERAQDCAGSCTIARGEPRGSVVTVRLPMRVAASLGTIADATSPSA